MYIIYAEYRWILVEYTQNTSHHSPALSATRPDAPCGRFGPSHLCGGHDTGWDNRSLLAQVSRVRSRSPPPLTARSLAPRPWERPRNPSGWSNNILEINPLHWAGTQNCIKLQSTWEKWSYTMRSCDLSHHFQKKTCVSSHPSARWPRPKHSRIGVSGCNRKKKLRCHVSHGIAGKVLSSMLFPLKARPFGAGISQPWN